ncbi:MAG: VWA domain-containing protein [Bacteroidetes bacterium]|nr:VWA domain-containing protein [Bacteroidota bacterium]
MNKFLLTIIGCLLLSSTSFAQAEKDQSLSPYFLIESNDPGLDQLPLKSTSADVQIAGVIADVTITQVYSNTGSRPIEAIYVFPGSTRAAVYGMEMQIGQRTIVAEIRERQQARAEYEAAKEEGKRASLLEQERPNVFQMNVANILPGDEIIVRLKYTELLVPEEGIYSFVYPTVVGPRYTGEMEQTTASTDPSFTATPYQQEGEAQTYAFDLNVQLNAGMAIQEVSSLTHDVLVDFPTADQAVISLSANEKISGGNRDYILDYRLAGGQIESGMLLYEHEDENYFLMMVQPPKRVEVDEIPPREYVFVVDVSGSMNGFPLDISKKLMRNLLTNLRPTDQFNVMLFSGDSEVLSEESLPVNAENMERGLDFVQNVRGGGGTNLKSALRNALALPRCREDVARSFVVITDGYVSVEQATFDLIRENLDEANLFSFGIGTGVNRHLIEGMAHIGQSEPLIITDPNEASAKADKFRQYLQSPVLTRIKVDYGKFEAYHKEPMAVPDVLAERPVIIYGKYRGNPQGEIKLTGHTGNGKYKVKLNVADYQASESNAAIRYLWARERIRLLDDYSQVSYNDEAIQQEVTELGLKYNLMTAYTSFVAIDHEPVAAGEDAEQVKQPVPLPQGVSNMAVGFDLGLEGVSFAGPAPDSLKSEVVLGAIHADLAMLQKALIKAWLVAQFEDAEICEALTSVEMTLQLKLDASGNIMEWKSREGNLTQAQKKCLGELFEDWKYDGVLPSGECVLQLEISF